MSEEDIRMLNSDFNYKHYGNFYERMEGENPDGAAPTLMDRDGDQ